MEHGQVPFSNQEGEFTGFNGVEIIGLINKTSQLTAFNTTARDDNVRYMAVSCPDDPLDLVTNLKQ